MSSILTWAVGGRQPENLDGNDTSAEWNKAARAAPGACCSRKGSCRVSGGQPGRFNILRAMPGGSK